MAKMIEIKCKECGKLKMVRLSDVKRGWGIFCSKSCKAKFQERKTGNYKKYLRNKKIHDMTNEEYFNTTEHIFSTNALGQD